jgi:hypothetical protein
VLHSICNHSRSCHSIAKQPISPIQPPNPHIPNLGSSRGESRAGGAAAEAVATRAGSALQPVLSCPDAADSSCTAPACCRTPCSMARGGAAAQLAGRVAATLPLSRRLATLPLSCRLQALAPPCCPRRHQQRCTSARPSRVSVHAGASWQRGARRNSWCHDLCIARDDTCTHTLSPSRPQLRVCSLARLPLHTPHTTQRCCQSRCRHRPQDSRSAACRACGASATPWCCSP